MIQRWKCTCAYDGTNFAGWQSQAKGRAIQDVIEERLRAIMGEPIRIHGSGRTDAGVHARGQVFHFDAAWRHGPGKLLAAFRVGLPPQIQVSAVKLVAPNFHARFDATGKWYRYRVYRGDADPFVRPFCWPFFRELEVTAMQAAAEKLRGRHDFRALTARNGPEREDTVRTLTRLEVRQRGREIWIDGEADGFLYKMMRSLAGALVAVGEGKLSLPELRRILQTGERTAVIQTAPAAGLCLMKVYY